MNLENLSPAPWESGIKYACEDFIPFVPGAEVECVMGDDGDVCYMANAGILPDRTVSAEFIALARNAFDVMMLRRWWACRTPTAPGDTGWHISTMCIHESNGGTAMRGWAGSHSFPDPFTALVEADKWYRENVEK